MHYNSYLSYLIAAITTTITTQKTLSIPNLPGSRMYPTPCAEDAAAYSLAVDRNILLLDLLWVISQYYFGSMINYFGNETEKIKVSMQTLMNVYQYPQKNLSPIELHFDFYNSRHLVVFLL